MFPQNNNTYQTGNYEVADDNSSHGPPALLLTGVKEDDAPEHVKQDDGHGHESWRRKIMQDLKKEKKTHSAASPESL